MAYEYNSSVLKRILPRLRQEEVNTGLRPNPALVRALWEGELSVEANKAYRSEEREGERAIQEEALALQKERDKAAASAARVSGVTNLAMGGALTYGVGKEMGLWGAKEAAKEAVKKTAQGQVANVAVGGGQTAVAGEALTTGGTATTGTGEIAAASTAESAAAPSAMGLGDVALPAAAAIGTKLIASKLGANQEWSNAAGGAVGGAMMLPALLGVTGPVGFVIGAVAGVLGGELGDSIICSELYRQGKIGLMYRRAGMLYGRMVGEDVYMGYIGAAKPIVGRMQTSKVFSWVVYQIAKPIMKEMIHRVNPRKEGSILGSIFLHYGIRHCINKYDSLPLSEVHYG